MLIPVPSKGDRDLNMKFMQTFEKDVYKELKVLAKERGISVQELLRAVVIPDWLGTKTPIPRRA